MTGSRVLVSLVVILMPTVVLPPAFAWTVNHRRVLRAQTDVAAIASGLRGDDSQLQRLRAVVGVLCGPGLVPRGDSSLGPWVAAPRGALASAVRDRAPLPIDPWG